MALLVVEGFEGFGTSTGVAPQPTDALGRYYTVNLEVYNDIETGRLGGYSLEMSATTASYLKTAALTVDDTVIVGVAVKFTVNTAVYFLRLFNNADEGIKIKFESGELYLYRGVTLLDNSVGLGLSLGAWYYIELKILCDDAVGTYEIRVGGANVCSGVGTDTKEHAVGDFYNIVAFFGMSGTGICYDDIYICDSTGAQNNDFLGNVRVVAITPDGDDSAGWDTASGGSSHYLDVDENPADDDTTYVEDGTTGHKDLYDYAAMPADLGTIKGLVVKTVCRETDASNFDLIMPIKSNITETDDGAQSIGTTDYVTKTRISELDPDTSAAWIAAGVNAAKFGVKVG